MAAPLLSVAGLRHRFPNGRVLDLPIQLKVDPGEAVAITGPSGSGKSTLLRAIAGCLDEDQTSWCSVMLPERRALALQDPEMQLFCTSVEEEIAFGLRNMGWSQPMVARRVRAALQAAGLHVSGDRSSDSLSTGQKQRVVLAALMAMEPALLLLDEPFSQLDEQGEAQLRAWLSQYKANGGSVIVTAHHVAAEDSLWDAHLELPCASLQKVRPNIPASLPPVRRDRADLVLQAEELACGAEDGEMVLDGVTLQLRAGSRVHLTGGNGTGKTTLLRCLTGLRKPDAGRICICGIAPPHPRDLAGRVGYLPQNADLILFEETVAQEVGFTLRRRFDRTIGDRLLQESLSICGLQELATQSPLCLSHGERHVVALASTLAVKPPVLLLDEPLTGLDDRLARSILEILDFCAESYGACVLLVSHGSLPVAWGDERFILEKGRLREA